MRVESTEKDGSVIWGGLCVLTSLEVCGWGSVLRLGRSISARAGGNASSSGPDWVIVATGTLVGNSGTTAPVAQYPYVETSLELEGPGPLQNKNWG